jgi:hypothetical protein
MAVLLYGCIVKLHFNNLTIQQFNKHKPLIINDLIF